VRNPRKQPASAAAWMRVAAPSFAIVARTCVSTVVREMPNSVPICFDERPREISCRISASLGDSPVHRSGGADRFVSNPRSAGRIRMRTASCPSRAARCSASVSNLRPRFVSPRRCSILAAPQSARNSLRTTFVLHAVAAASSCAWTSNRQSVRSSRKRVGPWSPWRCGSGAAFSPAGAAMILRTLAHVRVGDAAIQADTAVLMYRFLRRRNRMSGPELSSPVDMSRTATFTPEQDAELLRLNAAGVSIRMLARLRRETPSAVQRAIGRERKRLTMEVRVTRRALVALPTNGDSYARRHEAKRRSGRGGQCRRPAIALELAATVGPGASP